MGIVGSPAACLSECSFANVNARKGAAIAIADRAQVRTSSRLRELPDE